MLQVLPATVSQDPNIDTSKKQKAVSKRLPEPAPGPSYSQQSYSDRGGEEGRSSSSSSSPELSVDADEGSTSEGPRMLDSLRDATTGVRARTELLELVCLSSTGARAVWCKCCVNLRIMQLWLSRGWGGRSTSIITFFFALF